MAFPQWMGRTVRSTKTHTFHLVVGGEWLILGHTTAEGVISKAFWVSFFVLESWNLRLHSRPSDDNADARWGVAVGATNSLKGPIPTSVNSVLVPLQHLLLLLLPTTKWWIVPHHRNFYSFGEIGENLQILRRSELREIAIKFFYLLPVTVSAVFFALANLGPKQTHLVRLHHLVSIPLAACSCPCHLEVYINGMSQWNPAIGIVILWLICRIPLPYCLPYLFRPLGHGDHGDLCVWLSRVRLGIYGSWPWGYWGRYRCLVWGESSWGLNVDGNPAFHGNVDMHFSNGMHSCDMPSNEWRLRTETNHHYIEILCSSLAKQRV